MERTTALSQARARALERVREIALEVLGDADVRVYLFGSCATGSLRSSGDIDVVDLSTVSREFANRVRHEGLVWKG